MRWCTTAVCMARRSSRSRELLGRPRPRVGLDHTVAPGARLEPAACQVVRGRHVERLGQLRGPTPGGAPQKPASFGRESPATVGA